MQYTYQCPECGSPVVFSVELCGNCGVPLSWAIQQTNYYLPGPQQKKTKNWFLTFIGLIAIGILIGVLTTYGLIISEPSLQAPAYSATATATSTPQSQSQPQPGLLSAPTPLSPGSYADAEQTIDTIAPSFQWSNVPGANYYYLKISKFPYNSDDIVYAQVPLAGTSLIIPDNVLEYGQRYRWTIEAYNNTDSSIVSNALYFQTPDLLPSSLPDPAPVLIPAPVSPPVSTSPWAPVTLPGSSSI